MHRDPRSPSTLSGHTQALPRQVCVRISLLYAPGFHHTAAAYMGCVTTRARSSPSPCRQHACPPPMHLPCVYTSLNSANIINKSACRRWMAHVPTDLTSPGRSSDRLYLVTCHGACSQRAPRLLARLSEQVIDSTLSPATERAHNEPLGSSPASASKDETPSTGAAPAAVEGRIGS